MPSVLDNMRQENLVSILNFISPTRPGRIYEGEIYIFNKRFLLSGLKRFRDSNIPKNIKLDTVPFDKMKI